MPRRGRSLRVQPVHPAAWVTHNVTLNSYVHISPISPIYISAFSIELRVSWYLTCNIQHAPSSFFNAASPRAISRSPEGFVFAPWSLHHGLSQKEPVGPIKHVWGNKRSVNLSSGNVRARDGLLSE
jgi:hypothetical protein